MESIYRKTVCFVICLCVAASSCHLPCKVYDDDTAKIVTNFSSVARLRVDCSHRGLHEIPTSLPGRTYTLDLNGNYIAWVPAFIFEPCINMTRLDLSDNWISKLYPSSFKGLGRLEVLELGGNNLCLPIGYPDGVFKYLNSLKILKTYGNRCIQKHQNIPHQVFKDLASLERLSLDATVDELSFGSGFKELVNLTHLEVSSYNNCMSYHTAIHGESFSGLSNSRLTHLTLRGCAYRSISEDALTTFPNLNTLNVACTRNLNIQSVFESIYHMKKASLDTLILDGMLALSDSLYFKKIEKALRTLDQVSILRFLKQLSLNEENKNTVPLFCNAKLQNLKRLSVRENVILGKLSLGNDSVPCLPNLHHINVGINPIFDLIRFTIKDFKWAQEILKNGISSECFWSLQNIRTVDASKLLYNTLYYSNWFCSERDLDTEDYFRKPPKSIEDIPDLKNNFEVIDNKVKSKGSINVTDIDSFKGVVHVISVSPGTQVFFADYAVPGDHVIDPITKNVCPYVIYPYDTVVYFNISHNPMDLLTCPVLGTRSIRVLDGSFCSVTSVHKQNYWPNLTLLYLRGNKLNNTHEFPELFDRPMKLRELDLAQNGFRSLPDNSFEKLIHLEKLDISRNILNSVNLLLINVTRLELLDISFNMMPYLTKFFMKQVDDLFARNSKFRILLHGNPFTCECKSIPFLNWLKTTKVPLEDVKTMKCPNSTTLLVKVDTVKLAASCKVPYFEYYAIIASLSSFVLLVTVSSTIAYKKRWKIAWYVYTMKRRRSRYENLNENDSDKVYKAFVAYHIDHEIGNDPGITWIKNSLCNHVEKEWGQKLFIFDRNAEVGGSKIGETIHGIHHSEKVLFVITSTYLKKGNWEMVLYWALLQGINNVVICCLENINVDQLPVSLAKVAMQLQKDHPANYLEFRSDTSDSPSETYMWSNLKEALNCTNASET